MAKEDIERQSMAAENAESNNSLPHRERLRVGATAGTNGR